MKIAACDVAGLSENECDKVFKERTTQKFVIVGKKWHDKINGNTYHAVNIIDAGSDKLIFSSGLTYGYGEAWRQTAYEGLIKLKLAAEADRHNHELNRKDLFMWIRGSD